MQTTPGEMYYLNTKLMTDILNIHTDFFFFFFLNRGGVGIVQGDPL